jgi:hypothetical protein
MKKDYTTGAIQHREYESYDKISWHSFLDKEKDIKLIANARDIFKHLGKFTLISSSHIYCM